MPATYPKISQFKCLIVPREQQILRLQVWMDDAFLMDKFQREANLEEEVPDSRLTEI